MRSWRNGRLKVKMPLLKSFIRYMLLRIDNKYMRISWTKKSPAISHNRLSSWYLFSFFFFFRIWVIGNHNDKGSLNMVKNDKRCLLVRLRLDKNNSCSWLPGIARIKWVCACVWWWPYHEAAVCLALKFMLTPRKWYNTRLKRENSLDLCSLLKTN